MIKLMNKLLDGCIGNWNYTVADWVNEGTDEWKRKRPQEIYAKMINKFICKWFRESTLEWISEWISEYLAKYMKYDNMKYKWMNELLIDW